MAPKNLNIIGINCRGLSTKLGEFKLMTYIQKPEMVFLQETWLSKFEPKVIDYLPIWKHRAGGLGIMVRRGIQHQEIKLTPYANGFLEYQAIKVYLDKANTLVLLNIYNQGRNISIEEFRHYINQLGKKFLLIGDFNAHTPLLTNKSSKRNPTGKALEQLLTEDSICIKNPMNMYTYLSPTTGKLSCLDLCLTLPNLAAITHMEAGTDIGSDHRAIKITVQVKPESYEIIRTRRYLF